MKIAPIIRAIEMHNISFPDKPVKYILVHTGQHYDYEMSQVFFKDLEIPEPNIHLGVGSGTHAQQTGKVMIEFEKVLSNEKPDLVVVVGDVNSTLGAAVTAVKLHIPVAHIEAGLRSYDKRMPEEINRVLTDMISDYLFVPTRDAVEKLKKEGIPENRIYFVGNVMADSLLQHKAKAEKSSILNRLRLTKKSYGVITLHRPANVDDRENLVKVLKMLKEVSSVIPIVFPVHPRTRKNIEKFSLQKLIPENDRLQLIEPLGYLDFIKLMMYSRFVITDSGGVQEETTILNVPCLTLLESAVWEITITEGTNILVGTDPDRAIAEVRSILSRPCEISQKKSNLELWDGNAAIKIIDKIINNIKIK